MTDYGKPQFRTLPVGEVHLRQTVLAAINGRQVKGKLLRALFDDDAVTEGSWFCCAQDMAFRLRRLNGRATRVDAQDGAAMAMLLDEADAMLAEIEAALGVMFDPTEIGSLPSSACLILRVDLLDGAETITQLDLALSPDVPLLAMPAPFAPMLIGAIPLPARVMLNGPRLSPDDAASLAPGDLLLIGGGALAATLGLPGTPAMPGHIIPADRLFRPVA